uniref:Uncharacterized protein n=1 Tax=Cucumis melo TaxID=3656 RepID=A0A9I9DN72_CUCME
MEFIVPGLNKSEKMDEEGRYVIKFKGPPFESSGGHEGTTIFQRNEGETERRGGEKEERVRK